MLLAVVLIFAIAVAIFVIRRRNLQPQQPRATTLQPTSPQAATAIVQAATAKVTLEGHNLYYYDVTDESLVQFNLETSQKQVLIKGLIAISSVSLSPDKKYVLLNNLNTGPAKVESNFVVDNRAPDTENWWVYEVTSGTKVLLEPADITKAGWLGSGEFIISRQQGQKTIFETRGLDGNVVTTVATKPAQVTDWEVVPGGTLVLAWSSGQGQTTIDLIDTAKKQVQQVQGTGEIERVLFWANGTQALLQAATDTERRLFMIDLTTRKLAKRTQTFDLKMAARAGESQFVFIENGSIFQYDPAGDTIAQTGATVDTSQPIREIVTSGSSLFYFTDRGIYSVDLKNKKPVHGP